MGLSATFLDILRHPGYLSYVTGPLAAVAMRAVGLRHTWGWIATACVQLGVSAIALGFFLVLGDPSLMGLLMQTGPCLLMAMVNLADWRANPMAPLPFTLLPHRRRPARQTLGEATATLLNLEDR
jgi:hypothetical protein